MPYLVSMTYLYCVEFFENGYTLFATGGSHLYGLLRLHSIHQNPVRANLAKKWRMGNTLLSKTNTD